MNDVGFRRTELTKFGFNKLDNNILFIDSAGVILLALFFGKE